VIDAKARQSGDTWTISATIRHADTGWDHYADKFEVVAPMAQCSAPAHCFIPM
jgi:hypothetical protein